MQDYPYSPRNRRKPGKAKKLGNSGDSRGLKGIQGDSRGHKGTQFKRKSNLSQNLKEMETLSPSEKNHKVIPTILRSKIYILHNIRPSPGQVRHILDFSNTCRQEFENLDFSQISV